MIHPVRRRIVRAERARMRLTHGSRLRTCGDRNRCMAAKHGRFAQPVHAREPEHHGQSEHQPRQPPVGLWPRRAPVHVDPPCRCSTSGSIPILAAAQPSATTAEPDLTQSHVDGRNDLAAARARTMHRRPAPRAARPQAQHAPSKYSRT